MKYYLIFFKDGKVVSISEYDTIDARDNSYMYWYDETCVNGITYDNLQILNEVD